MNVLTRALLMASVCGTLLGTTACSSLMTSETKDAPPTRVTSTGEESNPKMRQAGDPSPVMRSALGDPLTNSRAMAKVNADEDDANSLANRLAAKAGLKSIYFDYDQFDIRPDQDEMLDQHAKFMQKYPKFTVKFEGNTDVRGGSEYNLALGTKRAEAVRKAMAIRGIGEERIEAVSFGKTKPKAEGNTEEAHAENRRVDANYR